ncbi:MAG TPA: hypothetical protein VFQ44_02080 [Streptosporangiaceae bacterium]|nr:hypothetical protein [Streptosporangiaceae bacterium]
MDVKRNGIVDMCRPGSELPKDYRKIAADLVANQGWGYKHGGKHATLYPADKTKSPVIVPTTPGDHRALKNFIAAVRQRGGRC